MLPVISLIKRSAVRFPPGFFSDVGDAFQIINHIMAERRRNTTGRSGVVVGRRRVKKRKGWRGVNPRPMVLRASALPLHHSDLMYFVSSLR